MKLQKLFFILLGTCVFLLNSLAFAQGADPEKKITRTQIRKAAKPKSTPKPSTPRKDEKASTTKNNGAPFYVTLSISVNEPEAEVFLTRNDGQPVDQDTFVTPIDGSPLEVSSVKGGAYTITVRKNGYFEEKKPLNVTRQGSNSVSFNLRPSSAFLSVRNNVEDAGIEIQGVGEYSNSVSSLLLPPGSYTVVSHKQGYTPEIAKVFLDKAGVRQELSMTLRPVDFQNPLALAEKAMQDGDYESAVKNARMALAVRPLNGRSALIAGQSYFKLSKLPEAADMLGLAISRGEIASFPFRVYNKEGSKLQLFPGQLNVTAQQIVFVPDSKAELAFSIAVQDVNELTEKTDEFGIRYINLKAKGMFGGKSSKRTVRLYPGSTAVKDAGKTIFCGLCTTGHCPCQDEERLLAKLLNSWQSGRIGLNISGFGLVLPSSENFRRYGANSFTLAFPENWTTLTIDNSTINAAPSGGFEKLQGGNQNISHGFFASVQENPENLDFNEAFATTARSVLQNNAYLQQGRIFASKLPSGNYKAAVFTGHSTVSDRDELITMYMTMRTSGQIFSITMVSPPDEKEEFEPVFNRILNSIEFR